MTLLALRIGMAPQPHLHVAHRLVESGHAVIVFFEPFDAGEAVVDARDEEAGQVGDEQDGQPEQDEDERDQGTTVSSMSALTPAIASAFASVAPKPSNRNTETR